MAPCSTSSQVIHRKHITPLERRPRSHSSVPSVSLASLPMSELVLYVRPANASFRSCRYGEPVRRE